jgi:transport and Golgi organization protein 2
MCTILLRWQPGRAQATVLAANRDEFRDRRADDPAAIAPGVFAGRDRTAGGTWLAVSRHGVAALTNVRTGARDPHAPSRGVLPLAALAGALPDPTPFNSFNLLVVDRAGARVVTHEGAGAPTSTVVLAPGVHVIDNEAFGRPSPRVVRAAALLDGAPPDFGLLGDHGHGPEDGLCHHGEVYGTVSATVVALDDAFRIVRYAHVLGPPCRGVPIDLSERARAVIG